jgi:hypothetical protein
MSNETYLNVSYTAIGLISLGMGGLTHAILRAPFRDLADSAMRRASTEFLKRVQQRAGCEGPSLSRKDEPATGGFHCGLAGRGRACLEFARSCLRHYCEQAPARADGRQTPITSSTS